MARDRFINATPEDYDLYEQNAYQVTASATLKLETERRLSTARLAALDAQLIELEVAMHIKTRWTPDTQQYIDTIVYLSTRNYQVKLDSLEGHVVNRIFELSRLNIAETGVY